MTRVFLFLTLAIASTSICGFAQDAFEGKIIYNITYHDLPEEMGMMESMLPVQSTQYIKGKKVRSEQSMGFMMNQTTLYDGGTQAVKLMFSVLGQKFYMDVSKQGEDSIKQDSLNAPSFKYFDETKLIAGYTCNRVEMIAPGMDAPATLYCASDIPGWQSDKFDGLKGFPLQYQAKQDGLSITVKAESISKEEVGDDLFVVPEDYKKVTQEELKSLLGG